METDLVLLEIAKKDLEATKILFNNKLYPQSIFYLQQCNEKAIKSYGLKLKIITELKEAKEEIGHKALKIYSKSYNQFRNEIATLDFIKIGDKKIKVNKSAIEKLPKAFPINEEELKVSFSREKLLNFITIINKSKDMLKIEVKEKEIEERMLYLLLGALRNIYPNVEIEELEEIKKEINKSNMKQFFVDFVNKWNKIYSKFFSCFSTLYYLNLIFSPHSINSRYPQNDFNPLVIYNDKMPLIEQLNSFIKITQETLEDLTTIFKFTQDEKLIFKQF